MGFFDIFKSKKQENYQYARVLNGYTPIFSSFGKDIYASGAVRQAIACIASEIKKLDPQHIKREGSDIIPVNDEIQKVLENPNPRMTTADFLEKIVWELYLHYNAFVIPVWNKDSGKLESLTPIHPVQTEFLEEGKEILYVKFTFANDYRCTLRYEDVIHIRYEYSVNELMGGGIDGQPDHTALLKTLELDNTLTEGVGKALKSSFAVNGVVKYGTIIDKEKGEKAIQDLMDSINKSESGFLPIDLKADFTPFKKDIKLVDADTLKFIDSKILRNFGVPLNILTGDYTTQQYEAFYQKTLEPLIKVLSQTFTKALFTTRESFGFSHKIYFYPKELVFLSMDQKVAILNLFSQSGTLTENEKRSIVGLKPLKELEGVRLQSLNYVDVDIAKKYQLGNVSTTPTVEDGESVNSNEVN